MKLYDFINKVPKPIRRGLYYVFLPGVEYVTYRKTKALYRTLVKPGDLVFDVGANSGDMTKILRQLGAKVVSVDPQPSALKTLHERFDSDSSVQIVPKGVSDKLGKLKFYVAEGKDSSGISTFVEDWKDKGKFAEHTYAAPIEVPVTTMDALVKQYGVPIFCKIDVEGFELKVLSGLNAKIPFISFEFTREAMDDIAPCLTRLEKLGKVRFNYSTFGNYEFECSGWVTKKELLASISRHREPNLCGDIFCQTK